LAIWQPASAATHTIQESLLEEVARRCRVNGGQISHSVLHASLLALTAAAWFRATLSGIRGAKYTGSSARSFHCAITLPHQSIDGDLNA